MKIDLDDPKLTAYALDELSGTEKTEVAAAVSASPQAQEFVREVRLLSGNLRTEYGAERDLHVVADANLIPLRQKDQPWSLSRRLALAAGIALCACLGAIAVGRMEWGILPVRNSRIFSFSSGSGVASTNTIQTPGDGIKPLAKKDLADVPPAPPPAEPKPTGPVSNLAIIASSNSSAAAVLNARPGLVAKQAPASFSAARAPGGADKKSETLRQDFNTARYGKIEENPFLTALANPLSTFSIDVDTASYSNIRRFIENGALPPKDAVRVEEMINYFAYEYPQPNDSLPFSVNLDAASCPWQPTHRLVRIGLKGRELPNEKRPPTNLVFLLDVSGSMDPANRLPLVKQAMRLLIDKLNENDRVAIVVYAGASGLALPSTTGDHKEQILSAIENLQANGSTNGAEGIELAYETASQHFIKGGVNRVILSTDGDFNVGTTSEGELINLIQKEAKEGVFLTVLGVGDDNLNDSMMQKLADKGNGNYAYLDSVEEAKKVLVRQINGTLVTIAKDVKVQVEFNPTVVASYRLIGYEKRMLRKEDFNNDKIDAGEIGAGHTVTVLYEVVPAGAEPNPAASIPPVDDLKYQPNPTGADKPLDRTASPELMTVKLRYKEPDGGTSKLISQPFTDRGLEFTQAAPDLKFAAAVAEFGMILRDSEYKGNASLGAIAVWAQEGKGEDPNGYRAAFLELLRKVQALKKD